MADVASHFTELLRTLASIIQSEGSSCQSVYQDVIEIQIQASFKGQLSPQVDETMHGQAPIYADMESDNIEWLKQLYGSLTKKGIVGNDKGGEKRESSSVNQGEKEGSFSIGQSSRINIRPLKSYLCRILAKQPSGWGSHPESSEKLDWNQKAEETPKENKSKDQGGDWSGGKADGGSAKGWGSCTSSNAAELDVDSPIMPATPDGSCRYGDGNRNADKENGLEEKEVQRKDGGEGLRELDVGSGDKKNMLEEEEEEKEEEEKEEGGEVEMSKVEKQILSREQRELFCFKLVKRKKDFICLERVNGKFANILDGLELHTGIFSAGEQTRIVNYVRELQEKGERGELKGCFGFYCARKFNRHSEEDEQQEFVLDDKQANANEEEDFGANDDASGGTASSDINTIPAKPLRRKELQQVCVYNEQGSTAIGALRDPFLVQFEASRIRIAAEFLPKWLPFLSRDLCECCTEGTASDINTIPAKPLALGDLINFRCHVRITEEWEIVSFMKKQLLALLGTLKATEPHYINNVEAINLLEPAACENKIGLQKLHLICQIGQTKLLFKADQMADVASHFTERLRTLASIIQSEGPSCQSFYQDVIEIQIQASFKGQLSPQVDETMHGQVPIYADMESDNIKWLKQFYGSPTKKGIIGNDKGGEKGESSSGTFVFEDFPSSPRSPLSPKKPWQTKGGLAEFNQGEKEGSFSIGQSSRINIRSLKSYLCHVLAKQPSGWGSHPESSEKLDWNQKAEETPKENENKDQGADWSGGKADGGSAKGWGSSTSSNDAELDVESPIMPATPDGSCRYGDGNRITDKENGHEEKEVQRKVGGGGEGLRELDVGSGDKKNMLEEEEKEKEKEEKEGGGEVEMSKVEKQILSREQRELFRFKLVKRKKDFICLERVNGKFANILDGLELHTGIFSAAEQTRIVNYVRELQEKGERGELKGRTFSAPRKWIRGKGIATLQFGCGYIYARDKYGNPPGILQNETVEPIPELLKVMIRRLVKWHVLPPSCVPDSCIVNIFDEGDCIAPHFDNHDFVRPFCTVSFESECNIVFGTNMGIRGPGEFLGYAIPLPVGSALVLKGNAADVSKHCVPSVPRKRISITFRKMKEAKRPIGFIPEPIGFIPQPLECEFGETIDSPINDHPQSTRQPFRMGGRGFRANSGNRLGSSIRQGVR